MSLIPSTYDEWRHCIEVKCQISLSENFCKERIKDLTEGKSRYATTFREQYGDHYTNEVVSWYQKALNSL